MAFWASASLFAFAASVMKPFWKIYCFKTEASTICAQYSRHNLACTELNIIYIPQVRHFPCILSADRKCLLPLLQASHANNQR